MATVDLGEAYGYANAVHAAGLVFFSGQIGLAEDGTAPSDPAVQFERLFATLARTLAAEDCGIADLVELVSFHTDFPLHMDAFIEAKSAFLGAARPTWTAVGVEALGAPGALAEIKATARSRRPG